MPFNPDAYLAKQPAFNPDAYLATQPTAPPAEQSNREFQPDVSSIEAFGRTARSVATGGLGERVQSQLERFFAEMPRALGGQLPRNPDEAKTFQEMYGQNASGAGQAELAKPEEIKTEGAIGQHPVAAAAGAVTGLAAQSLATQPINKAVEEVGSAALGGAKRIAQGFKALSNDLSAGTMKISDSVLKRLGGTKGVQSLGQTLMDEGVTNTPGTLRITAKRLSDALSATGGKLANIYKTMDKEIPVEKWLSKIDLKEGLNNFLKADAVDAGTEYGVKEAAAMSDRLSTIMAKYADDKPLSPSAIWDVVQKMERQGGKFIKNAPPALESENARLITAADHIRDRLTNLGEGISQELPDTNRVYRLLKIANNDIGKRAAKPRQISNVFKLTNVGNLVTGGTAGQTTAASGMQAAANTAAWALSQGAKLGKYYKMLNYAVPKGLQAVATRHAYLMVHDEKYRGLIDLLRSKTTQAE